MGFIILLIIIVLVCVGLGSGGGGPHIRGPRITKFGRFHRW